MVRGVGLKWLLLGTVLCGAIRLNAQEFSEWQLEEVESGESEVLQLLEDLRRQPLAVNHATRTELLKIPFLTPEHARALVRYRQQHGPFKDWKDLETIPGWHPELAEAVRPYFNLKQKRSGPRGEIQMRLSRSGEAVSGTGSPIALQQRLVFRPVEGLRIFLATDKDPGEADWRDLTTGALSGTVARNKLSWVFGDFSWTAGQGLILSGPYGYPLAPASWQPFRHGLLDLDARHSPAENGFWRGAGGGWQVTDRIMLTGGWSRQKLDARLEPRTGWVATLPQSGYHRTPTELAGAALLGEERRAVAGTWQTGFLTLGGLTNHLSYDIPVLSPAGLVRETRQSAFFYRVESKEVVWQGEQAWSVDGYPAAQHSFWWKKGESARLVLGTSGYYYHPLFWSPHGRALGAVSGDPGDLQGVVMSLELRGARGTRGSGLLQFSRAVAPWETIPLLRQKRQLVLEKRWRGGRFYARYDDRQERDTEGWSLGANREVRGMRLNLTLESLSGFTLTQRVEYRGDRDGATASALMCGGKWAGRRGTYTLRWSQFEVPQSNLRIYEYEEDLPGTFRTAQLNGRGYKWYCSARWQVKKQFDVAAKYHRQTVLPDQGDPILASAENPQTRELWRLQLLVNF